MFALFEHAKTIHLFMRSDYKTALLPVALLSYFAAPHTTPIFFTRGFVRAFLQILYFCISNQAFDPEEDALNKPWRPIPAGRISVRGANILRAVVLPVCFALSWWWDVMLQCIVIVTVGTVYSDFNLGVHWLPRHVFLAALYWAMNSGVARAACDVCPDGLDTIDIIRHTLNDLVILTTIQAADFRDIEGDSARGRSTVPLRWPSLSRLGMPVILLVCSAAVCTLSNALGIIRAIFMLLGLVVGFHFRYNTTPKQDRQSYLWYYVRSRGYMLDRTES